MSEPVSVQSFFSLPKEMPVWPDSLEKDSLAALAKPLAEAMEFEDIEPSLRFRYVWAKGLSSLDEESAESSQEAVRSAAARPQRRILNDLIESIIRLSVAGSIG